MCSKVSGAPLAIIFDDAVYVRPPTDFLEGARVWPPPRHDKLLNKNLENENSGAHVVILFETVKRHFAGVNARLCNRWRRRRS